MLVSLPLRLTISTTVVAIAFAILSWTIRGVLPAEGRPAHGVLIAGRPIPFGQSAHQRARALADQLEARTLKVFVPGQAPRELSLAQLGVCVQVDDVARRALAVGRQGPLEVRFDQSLRARKGAFDVPLRWTIDPSSLQAMVIEAKDSVDQGPIPAKYDFETKSVRPHEDGQYLDLYAALADLDRAARTGAEEFRVERRAVPPAATTDLVQGIDINQVVGRYETSFGYLGGQANRGHNVKTAALRLDGIVMMPDQIISFNDIVGHRTLQNGFRKGWEIFKGEMVEGVGGGTCQAASTLHAAAYLSGLHIVDRAPHSRPSGYMPVGLDATVVDGLVDLKIRNTFDFPVVVHSKVDKGKLTFELLGKFRAAQVTYRSEVIGVSRYKRKVTEAGWLTADRVIRKQRGIRGYTVRRTRLLRFSDGTEREEVTIDSYPPTPEIYLVAPGADPERDLPPLPFDVQEPAAEPPDDERLAEASSCTEECPPRPVIEDAPAARTPVPVIQRSVIIHR